MLSYAIEHSFAEEECLVTAAHVLRDVLEKEYAIAPEKVAEEYGGSEAKLHKLDTMSPEVFKAWCDGGREYIKEREKKFCSSTSKRTNADSFLYTHQLSGANNSVEFFFH